MLIKIPSKCAKSNVNEMKEKEKNFFEWRGGKIFAVYSNVKIPFCLMMQTYTPSLAMYYAKHLCIRSTNSKCH
jgi:hypothetical protein